MKLSKLSTANSPFSYFNFLSIHLIGELIKKRRVSNKKGRPLGAGGRDCAILHSYFKTV